MATLETSLFGKVTGVFEHGFMLHNGDEEFIADIGGKRTTEIGVQKGDRILVRGILADAEMRVAEIVMGLGSPYIIR